MILKTKRKSVEGVTPIYGYSLTDHISHIEIRDNEIIGGWDNKEGSFEESLEPYSEMYILNDNGQTIEKINLGLFNLKD